MALARSGGNNGDLTWNQELDFNSPNECQGGFFLFRLCNAKLNFLNLLHCDGATYLRGVRTCFVTDAGLAVDPPAIEMARCRCTGRKNRGIVK